MKPLISIIIAAYNEELLIKRCLQVVMNQKFSYGVYEVLVIDNNSTDKTGEIAHSLGATVIKYTEKQGASVAKQYGAYRAKGEIIVFIDSDSVPDPDWLERIYRALQDKRLVCVGGAMIPLWGNAWTKFVFAFFDYFAYINQWFGIYMLWGSNLAIRKEAFLQVGGINTTIKTSDDWELVARLAKRYGAKSIKYLPSMRVKTSPRKQESLRELIPYISIGIANYFSLYILRRSVTYGTPKVVR